MASAEIGTPGMAGILQLPGTGLESPLRPSFQLPSKTHAAFVTETRFFDGSLHRLARIQFMIREVRSRELCQRYIGPLTSQRELYQLLSKYNR